MLDARAECMKPTAPLGPVRVAVDNYYAVVVPELGFKGGFHGSPNNVEDAVTGLLLREGMIEPGDQAEIVEARPLGERRFQLRARVVRAAAAWRPPRGSTVDWGSIETLYADFVRRVSKRVCPYAIHSLAAYLLQQGAVEPLFFVTDVSRHAAALKTAGMVSRLLSAKPGMLEDGVVVVASTGRISGDMVAALARAGVRVIVSNHHPVLSGIAEAQRRGVALVLRSPDSRGLAVYTEHDIIYGGPRVLLEPARGGGEVYVSLPSPLC